MRDDIRKIGWARIKEAPNYEINRHGVVRHIRLEKEQRVRRTMRNEPYVLLPTADGSQRTFYIENLLAEYFDGAPRDPNEVWKMISVAWDYDVSNRGRVRNRRTQRILRTHPNNRTGMPQVTMMDAGVRITRQVHTLVEEAFGG